MFGALTALPGKNRSHSVQVRSTNLNLTEVSAFLYRHFLNCHVTSRCGLSRKLQEAFFRAISFIFPSSHLDQVPML